MADRRIGNYRVIEYIGSGGFGTVFKAEDVTSPGRIVAIKELHKKHTRNPSVKQRFFQEAVAMARMDHPNLPRLFTFGEEDGSFYLVMELLSGRSLTEELHSNGRVPEARAVTIVQQVLNAMGYSHGCGIIHRDLKPDNIFLLDGEEPRVKVLDFGIARMIGGENLTLTGEGFGTPAYMSPERIRGDASVDQRTDIYSIGIIFYEMLTGRAPFHFQSTDPLTYWSEMRRLHESEPLPPLSDTGVSTGVEEIIRKATAKTASERFASADEMLKALPTAGIASSCDDKPLVSRLELTTVPGRAAVYVDDACRGESDELGKMLIGGLTSGLHSVRVVKPSYDEYNINVSLEAGRQTDLHVALSARATVAIPRDATTPVESRTDPVAGGDEAATALLVLDSLPPGSSVRTQSGSALAGDDGRATVRLEPGTHEIEITSPDGATTRKLVTVAPGEIGTTRQIPLRVQDSGSPRSTWGRAAFAAALILILGLIATGYWFITSRQSDQQNPEQAASDSVEPAETMDAAELQKLREEIAALERRLEGEKPNRAPAPSASSDQAVKVEGKSPAKPESTTAVGSATACLSIKVVDHEDNPRPGMRIVLIEHPEADMPAVHKGVTSDDGQWRYCGLEVGAVVRGAVLGPNGRMLATRAATVPAGNSSVTIKLPSRQDSLRIRPRQRLLPRQP